jgi:excisionase family DNA binding protein
MVQKRREVRKVETPREDSAFYTVREAAERLGVSTSTVWRWIDAGQLAAVRVGPRAIRIRSSDVQTAVRPARQQQRVPGEHPIYTDVSQIPPWTEEDRQRTRRAMAEMDKLSAKLMAKRGGRLFPDSAKIIRDEREKRSRHLLSLAGKPRR